MTFRKPVWASRLLALLILLPVTAIAQEDLAKESQNPVGNIISVPFENTLRFDEGPEGGTFYALNLKPVYPVQIGEFTLINRAILPLIHQGERFAGEGSKTGLGDFTYQGFVTPAKPGKIIWGLGPALVVPTHTDDRLGTDKWSAGPALVVLAKPGKWLFGTLIQQFWSFAGDSDETDVSLGSMQIFINYNFEGGWYATSTPTFSANWEANSDNRYTVPVGGGIGRLVKFGKQPVDFKGQVFYNVEKPETVSDVELQFQIKFLFPK